jgi:hypothetical protein
MGEILQASLHFDECIPLAAESEYPAHGISFMFLALWYDFKLGVMCCQGKWNDFKKYS